MRASAFAAAVCASLLSAFGVARATDPVASCVGQPDNTPCFDNGDGCTDESGFDLCTSGVCGSPGPCLNTVFRATGPTSLETKWEKPFSTVVPGESCESQGSATAAEVGAITGVVVGDPQARVPLTRSKAKRVPRRGRGDQARVVLRLRLNTLGRRLLKLTARQGHALNVVVVMRLNRPDAPPVSARRPIELRRVR